MKANDGVSKGSGTDIEKKYVELRRMKAVRRFSLDNANGNYRRRKSNGDSQLTHLSTARRKVY